MILDAMSRDHAIFSGSLRKRCRVATLRTWQPPRIHEEQTI
jgi:hypothetical protein